MLYLFCSYQSCQYWVLVIIRLGIFVTKSCVFFIFVCLYIFQDMVKTEKNSVVESGKKHFSENKSSGDYSYPEWNKAVIPPVSRKLFINLNVVTEGNQVSFSNTQYNGRYSRKTATIPKARISLRDNPKFYSF